MTTPPHPGPTNAPSEPKAAGSSPSGVRGAQDDALPSTTAALGAGASDGDFGADEFDTSADQHRRAAHHFAAAARHHLAAAAADDEGLGDAVAHHAFLAYRHQLKALQFADMAVMNSVSLDELDDDLADDEVPPPVP